MNKKISRYLLLFLLVVILFCGVFFVHNQDMKSRIIVHAMGQNNGLKYTNSLEGFNSAYKKGYRQFETDLTITTDKKVVCFHKYSKNIWKNLNISQEKFSYDEFMSGKVFENIPHRVTPFDLQDLITLMKTHRNIKIMLHIHSENSFDTDFVLGKIEKLVGEDEKLYDRFILGINFIEEFEVIKRHKIKNLEYYISKPAKRPEGMKNIDDIIKFMNNNGIKTASVPVDVVKNNPKEIKKLKKNNIFIYSFTTNDMAEMLDLYIKGVNVVGSDLLFKTELGK